jgi:hypothetical protein
LTRATRFSLGGGLLAGGSFGTNSGDFNGVIVWVVNSSRWDMSVIGVTNRCVFRRLGATTLGLNNGSEVARNKRNKKELNLGGSSSFLSLNDDWRTVGTSTLGGFWSRFWFWR